MDRAEILREMIAEWERELAESASAPEQSTPSSKSASKHAAGGDLLSVVRDWEFYNKSQPEAAKAFLEKLNHPAKTQVIVEALVKGGVTVGGKSDKDKKQNLYTILYRSPEFGLVAKAKDTWGLMGWPGVTKKESKDGNGTGEGKKAEEAEVKK
jgi:hypothetical protein